MSMEKLYNPSCGYRHPPECQNYISQIGRRYGKTCFFDMLSWRKSPTKSRRKEVRMDQLQVREAHLSSDKVSADQTSDNINAKDNMMSPNWHLWRSRHLEKATRCLSNWTSGRPPDFVMVRSDLLLKKVKRDCLRRLHLIPDKVNADQDISEGWTSRKSHTVLSCLTSEGSFAAPISLVRFRHDSRLTLKKVKSDCFRRSLPIRTSENINDKDNRIHFDLCEGQGWTSKKTHGAFMLDFWKATRFRHGFPTQAWLFVKLTSYTWQSRCRSTHQRRSRHLEKVTRCSHAWLLQNLSLRLSSWVRFRLIPSVSEGYIPRIPPRSSTRRTITKKKHHWVFQSRSRMKNPEAAAASQQLARYRRCLVLVQATALGNHSETVFLRQVCFFN